MTGQVDAVRSAGSGDSSSDAGGDTGSDKPSTREERQAQTRVDLLVAGAELLSSSPVGDVLSQIKADKVARRAGRTIGAFYHHWGTQRAYRDDLLTYVLDVARQETSANSIQADTNAGIPLMQLVRERSRENFERTRSNEYFPLQMALWGKALSDAEIASLLRKRYHGTSERLIPAYEQFLKAQGLVVQPPFTIEILATSLTAIVEGLTLRAAVDPESVPLHLTYSETGNLVSPSDGGDDDDWDLFGLLALNCLKLMTAPRG